ncbi:MAG: Uma2 family endonuclease [Planctomycetota bacterium]|nr:Uma2 family endonuclease [Planctomycetaceae bacterium]MDQ3329452.1 Uma2 family endonuclease [Planctomycetota bacterium]
MTTVVEDKDLERQLRRHRKRTGADRYDEVWDGVYVMAAMPNNDHQRLVNKLAFALETVVGQSDRGVVFPGVNISDQPTRWKRNYRCPDIVVFLDGNPAEDRGTHWFGGPDLAIEIESPGDRSLAKLPFYAKVGTRDVLLVRRDPWQLELFRLSGNSLTSVGVSAAESQQQLHTESVPFTWRIVADMNRPRIEMACTEDERRWVV